MHAYRIYTYRIHIHTCNTHTHSHEPTRKHTCRTRKYVCIPRSYHIHTYVHTYTAHTYLHPRTERHTHIPLEMYRTTHIAYREVIPRQHLLLDERIPIIVPLNRMPGCRPVEDSRSFVERCLVLVRHRLGAGLRECKALLIFRYCTPYSTSVANLVCATCLFSEQSVKRDHYSSTIKVLSTCKFATQGIRNE